MQSAKQFSLNEKYPPSEPCSCDICKSFCMRPGWWTVKEATKAFDAGYWDRMMLEISPDYSYGVLAPAFYGCEQDFALQNYSTLGCNFFKKGLCELHGTGLEPLECRFCHHDRMGQGQNCHLDIAKDWKTKEGQILVLKWERLTGIRERYGIQDQLI